MDSAYVYKWVHNPTLKWYVGYHSGFNPKYICSSKIVLPLIKANPEEWERTIVATGTAEEMYLFESDILQTFDARYDIRSFNQSNNTAKRTNVGTKTSEEVKKKLSLAKLGKPSGRKGLPIAPLSEETRKRMSESKKGRKPNNFGTKRNPEAIKKFQETMRLKREARCLIKEI